MGEMLTPSSEVELARMVAEAEGPLRVIGGDTRGMAEGKGDVLSTSGLSGVQLYEPGALTLVVKAGTPVDEVEALLAKEGQRLPFEPMDHRALLGTDGTPTMGGLFAANVSGPRRIAVGAARDFLLGVRFIDGQGRLLKNGGRVMKNVTGYDLVKLMAGSYGTLGVMTELSLKVLAIPQAEASVVCTGLTAEAAVKALSAGLGSPFDVSGAAHGLSGTLSDTSMTLLRVEGLTQSVGYRAAELQKRLGNGWRIVEGAESAALWTRMRHVTPLAGLEGAIWKVSVKPSDGPKVLKALAEDGLEPQGLMDWGGGLLWLALPETVAAGERLRGHVGQLGGHATLVRAGEDLRAALPRLHPQATSIAALEEGLRARFDPHGIFTPRTAGRRAA